MIVLSRRLTKNMAIELALFHFVRNFTDGISFVEFRWNLDLYKGDHSPKFTIHLILLNFTIFELNIYNTNHE